MAGKKSAVYGELQRKDGIGAPMPVLAPIGTIDKAGYKPERLDPLIQTLIQNCEIGSAILLKYTPMLVALMEKLETELTGVLENLMPPSPNGEPVSGIPDAYKDVVRLAEDVSKILERLNKMMMQSVRAKDDATRLRTFLATGDVDDGGLAALGENQLREMVLKAAQGWQKDTDSAT